MSEQEAKHILDKHTVFFNFIKATNEVPDASMPIMEEIYQALNTLEPYFWNRTCSTCTFEMLKRANEKREGLKKFTFPKQE